MQTPIRNFEESKPVTAGAMTPFNVNCYDVIQDLIIEFTNSGAAATRANCLSSISRVVVLINGMNAVDVKLSQIDDLQTFLGSAGNKIGNTYTTSPCFSLNMGRLLYNAGFVRDEFAWRCGVKGETDPTKKISSLVVQVYAGGTVTGITDVNLYSLRKNVEAAWTDSYIQFNNNVISYAATGQSQVNTLPKNANDLFLCGIAYNGSTGVISQGETLVNNTNVSRAISLATNNYLNELAGYGAAPTGAFVHLWTDGTPNSGLFVSDVTSELSVRTTFTTAPTSSYDLAVVKIHNCPEVLKQIVNGTSFVSLSSRS